MAEASEDSMQPNSGTVAEAGAVSGADSEFGIYKGDVDEQLRIDTWRRWKTRFGLVDAVSINEATALSFGIRVSAVQKLSDDTEPTIDRFEFRRTTLLAAVQAGKIKLLAKDQLGRAVNPDDLIVFSDFVRFVRSSKKMSIPSELIGLIREIHDGSIADARSGKSWESAVFAIAENLWLEKLRAGERPTKNSIKDKLASECKQAGIKTSRNRAPTAETLSRHVLPGWTPPELPGSDNW
jgi:hypothetical protein